MSNSFHDPEGITHSLAINISLTSSLVFIGLSYSWQPKATFLVIVDGQNLTKYKIEPKLGIKSYGPRKYTKAH